MKRPNRVEETRVPAVVTAGGRLAGDLAAVAGTSIKALAPLGPKLLAGHVLDALANTANVGPVAIVGPVDALTAAGLKADHLIAEGATGPENVVRGLEAVGDLAGDGHVLVCTTDLPFLTSAALRNLLDRAPADADIVFPVVEREAYLDCFPGAPSVFAPMAGRFYTGGSVLLMRPSAIARNHALIERVFDARKSQLAMARLLGLPFLLRFVTKTLTIPQAEARASNLTGCACRALMDADPRLAADVDHLVEYEWAQAHWPRFADAEQQAGKEAVPCPF